MLTQVSPSGCDVLLPVTSLPTQVWLHRGHLRIKPKQTTASLAALLNKTTTRLRHLAAHLQAKHHRKS